jgi:hypothetical protein
MKDSDRRRQLAHDGIDPDDGGETIPPALAMQLQQFAKGKMSDADFSEFVELLGNLSGVSLSTDEILGPEETEAERRERLAKRGRESGGGCGLDAGRHSDRRLDVQKAEAEFRKLFPDAGAVASDFGVVSRDERMVHTARAEAEFRKICPDAKPLIRV